MINNCVPNAFVFVICCYAKNYHNLSGLTQHLSIILQSLWVSNLGMAYVYQLQGLQKGYNPGIDQDRVLF
jgi:hypothetical protein